MLGSARRNGRHVRDVPRRRRDDPCRPSRARLKVAKNDPLQAHHELLDRITDKNIHDLVAYLETMK